MLPMKLHYKAYTKQKHQRIPLATSKRRTDPGVSNIWSFSLAPFSVSMETSNISPKVGGPPCSVYVCVRALRLYVCLM